MERISDVLIIGGGIMGCSLAYNLAKRGVSVTVLEKTTCGSEGSGRNSSGVRAQCRDPKELKLAMQSEEMWLTLSEELDYDVEYRRIGNLQLAYDEQRMQEYRERVEREQAAGLPVRMVGMDEIRQRLPYVNLDDGIDGQQFLGGTLCDSDGTADPLRATKAFHYAAVRAGAVVLPHVTVTGMTVENHKVTKVHTTAGDFAGGVVVNAAGAWGREIGRMAGVDVPIEPYLCQVCITQKLPPDTLQHYLCIHPYAFWNQTAHGNLLYTNAHAPLNQFPHHDVGYDVVEYLCRVTQRIFKPLGVSKLALIRTYSGWNEVTPDGCAMMGFAGDPENFFVDAGYSGHGFCLGPASGVACADLILNGRTDLAVSELAFARFDKTR